MPQGLNLVNIIASYSTLLYTVLRIMLILFLADNYTLRYNEFYREGKQIKFIIKEKIRNL